MRRRNFMAMMGAALTGALLPCAGLARERDHVAFVRRLYQREILRDVGGGKIGDAEFHRLFTRDVRRLLQSPIRRSSTLPIGPLLHAFYGPAVLPGMAITLQGAAPAPGTSVAVDLKVRKRRRVPPRASWTIGHKRLHSCFVRPI